MLRPGGAKAKGAAGERELAALLQGWATLAELELELCRNLEQTRGGGHDLKGLEPHMAIEVKRHETLNVQTWWRQAVRQAEAVGPDCVPVLAYRQNRKPWKFMLRVWVYPCKKVLDIEMHEPMFKLWFIQTLEQLQ